MSINFNDDLKYSNENEKVIKLVLTKNFHQFITN